MGAPRGNSNAETHGLYSDRKKLYQRLDKDERKLVIEISEDLMDRVQGEIGAYEREAIRNIAVDTLKRNRANANIVMEDYIESGEERADRVNKAYSRLVRDTTNEMEKLGLLEDGPEMKKAEAQAGWMDQIEDAKDDLDE